MAVEKRPLFPIIPTHDTLPSSPGHFIVDYPNKHHCLEASDLSDSQHSNFGNNSIDQRMVTEVRSLNLVERMGVIAVAGIYMVVLKPGNMLFRISDVFSRLREKHSRS